MLGIFVNNSFLESNSKCIFKDTDFPHKLPTVFQANYIQTNFSNIPNTFYLFKPYNIFENFGSFFSCRFYYLSFNHRNFYRNSACIELPLVFNSLITIESPSSYLKCFIDFG